MFKISNKNRRMNSKANIFWDVVLDVFAYIVIIAAHSFTFLYMNLLFTYIF